MSKICKFTVNGPFDLKLPPAKRVTDDAIIKFWEVHSKKAEEIKNESGIYIFYKRYGKKHNPLYVGKTSNQNGGFEKEVFQPHKITKYDNAIRPSNSKKSIPGKYGFLFLVLDRTLNSGHVGTIKKYHEKRIKELENHLIHQGYIKNPGIQNDHKTKSSMPKWSIRGLTGKGRASKGINSYNLVFGIEK